MKFCSLIVFAAACALVAAQDVFVRMCVYSGSDENVNDCSSGTQFCQNFSVGQCQSFTDVFGSVEVQCDEQGGTVTFFTNSDCTGAGQGQNFDSNVCQAISANEIGLDFGIAAEITCTEETTTPQPTPSGTDAPPTEAPTPTPSPVCFADESEVRLADGSARRLRDVQVGDLVQSYDDSGRATFSEVFLVQHAGATQRVEMRRIEFSADHASGSITVSGRHFLDGGADGRMVRADELRIGDAVYVVGTDGTRAKALVQAVSTVHAAPRNVHTMNDRVVVDGVLATPFAAVDFVGMNSMRLRALLLPLKGMHLLGFSPLVRALDDLAHALVVAAQPAGSLQA